MRSYLDFEKQIAELDEKIAELRGVSDQNASPAISGEVERLEAKADQATRDLYARLTPWQKTQVARHPARPHFKDYVAGLISEFTPMAGDRKFAEDEAVVGGLGRFRGKPVMVIGHEKGSDTESRIRHNFGMARPEGYRKAVRLMELADRFNVPVITLVDTAGAYPGIGAEERGQAEAIARSTECCLRLGVANVAVIVGEGGSGGAVAIATASSVLMLEHAIYTVASPEASASILWRDSNRAVDAATNMKITAQDLLRLGVIDEIIGEPVGGAHRDPAETAATLEKYLTDSLRELKRFKIDTVLRKRYERIRNQVFDKGQLSDGEGRVIDFRNTVLMMTSNLGSDLMMDMISKTPGLKRSDVLAAMRPILSKHFKPALLARMTIVPYFPLGPSAMREIVDLKLAQLVDRVHGAHRIALALDEAVPEQIVARCSEVETGARNIDHILRRTLMPLISQALLEQMSSGELSKSMRLVVDEQGGYALSIEA